MQKRVISEIANKETFIHILEHNPGLIVLKLGGEALVEVSCRSLLLRLFLDAPHQKGGGGT